MSTSYHAPDGPIGESQIPSSPPEYDGHNEKEVTYCCVCKTTPSISAADQLDNWPLTPSGSFQSTFSIRELASSSGNGCGLCETLLNGIIAWAPPGYLETAIDNGLWVTLAPCDGHLQLLLSPDGGSRGPKLRYFLEDGLAAPKTIFGTSKLVPLSYDSEQTMEQARTWLRYCSQTHTRRCIKERSGFVPTRLLQLSSFDQVCAPNVKLVTTHRAVDYLTLSYCWGKGVHFKTTKNNSDERGAGMPWAEIPQTFKDAVQITMKLGYYYIWIDALCIIQDDLLDWERESSRMADIYSSAVLTIYAAASTGAEDGIFRKKTCGQLSNGGAKASLLDSAWCGRDITTDLAITQYRQSSSKFWTVYVQQIFHSPLFWHHRDDAMLSSPLDSRGWAFQEKILSRRILHFRESELVWECRESCDCECGMRRPWSQDSTQVHGEDYERQLSEIGLGNPEILRLPRANKSADVPLDTLGLWCNIVEQYSRAMLSYREDVLPALSGIAKRMQKLQLGKYLGGLWESQLPQTLCWRSMNPDDIDEQDYCLRREHRVQSKYLAPSWSWASGPYATSMAANLQSRHAMLSPCRVLQAECFPSGVDPTGRLVGGHLTVEAPTLYLKFTSTEPGWCQTYKRGLNMTILLDDWQDIITGFPLPNLREGGNEHEDQGRLDLVLSSRGARLLSRFGEVATFAMLLILTTDQGIEFEICHALLVKSSEEHVGCYERLGTMLIYTDDVSEIAIEGPPEAAWKALYERIKDAPKQTIRLV